ncbi:MAG TPA: class I SAM-dependent methyltransferase [Gaiellaceae bacterium]|nr:class I SAM-dependent methyltransferase [Gaiellaceae bacterium]
MSTTDCWAEWLATRRFGGDEETRREVLARLGQTRDTVLDRADLVDGDTLLDVGCGEGLIGFGALERGADVVFSDVSEPLLDLCRSTASSLGVADRCRFLRAAADALSPVESETVDVVTTRSVLIYVSDKAAALREFFRVLRPGGRVSLYEPINSFAQRGAENFGGYPVGPVAEEAAKVRALFEALQPPVDPMLDFDERDLFRLSESAGFFPVDVNLHLELVPQEARPWEAFANTAWNPRVPSLAEAMDQVLQPDEQERFRAHLQPLVESGAGTWRMGHAYLRATKPGESVRR